ncbi:glucose dehydrogenase [Xaviernesmea oryzae]|uniref:Glucose dehydrogenase n=1 Tax=Xaviernesmea oryzae TaxID=464029 RepID=A0A1Q9AXS4_9HYPH|nr:PQQ-dependent sugar dehydrogenase [Xaviernesmea oryzae]OLP60248.1 glucose dehydrogenase [Xaviernesmea oryzae]SEK26470.1 Glucose/arabinose dehydrogenase, beta-propeller fold [Xaviernesmea oryzae]
MPRLLRLTARSALALLLAGTAGLPALAQSTGDTSPIDHVEGEPPATGAEQTASGQPVETRPANVPDQKPAFAGQTRAPQPSAMPTIRHTAVAVGLPQLWAMEILPDGRMLVTAKEGTLYLVAKDGTAVAAVSGTPKVVSSGQAGLLDVALAPDFDSSRRIYFSFSEPREDGNGTSVATAVLKEDDKGARLDGLTVIFRQMPSYDNTKHYGSRLVFDREGALYVTVGERSDAKTRVFAQDLASGFGKVFRITPEGKAADGNPFAGREGAKPEIWSYGHRNLQSAALDGEGRLWTVEHGPRGGDELNRPEAGKNYGWPVITYGMDYSGKPIGDGITQKAGLEQPVYYWDPVIGPSGMAFYDGDRIPEWKGAFLIGGLVSTGLVVLHVEGDRVMHEERVPLQARIRDVKIGPDGAVYAVTEEPDAGTSSILRLERAG